MFRALVSLVSVFELAILSLAFVLFILSLVLVTCGLKLVWISCFGDGNYWFLPRSLFMAFWLETCLQFCYHHCQEMVSKFVCLCQMHSPVQICLSLAQLCLSLFVHYTLTRVKQLFVPIEHFFPFEQVYWPQPTQYFSQIFGFVNLRTKNKLLVNLSQTVLNKVCMVFLLLVARIIQIFT